MRMRWLTLILLLLVVGATALVLWRPATLYVSLGLVRQEAFFEGKPTSYWARALKQEPYLGEAPAEFDVGKTLRQGGSAAVPVLCELAQSPDDNLRSEALVALSLMGSEAKSARSVLEETLRKETNPARFVIASDTLAQVDPADAVAVLDEIIQDNSHLGRRAWALQSLLKLGPEGRGALPALRKMFADPEEDPSLRLQVVEVLWGLQEPAEPLAAALMAIASAPKSPVAVEALTVLGKMGPAAKGAVPALLDLLKKPGVPLEGRRWGTLHRSAVVTALGDIGPDARTAVPELIALLRIGIPVSFRVELAAALNGIGSKEALAARDALGWTTVTCLGARGPADLITYPLVRFMQGVWVPRDTMSRGTIRVDLQKVDPRWNPARSPL